MTKHLLLVLMLTCSLASIKAQDIVVDNTGREYDCYITDEDSSAVYFRYERDGMRIDTSIARHEVFNYRYNIKVANDLEKKDTKAVVSYGICMGGSNLIGVEFERLIGKRYGAQVGAGLFGFSAGLNVHFFETLRSSFASLQVWYTGLGDSDSQWIGHKTLMVGPSITYRNTTGWFTGTFGIGYVIEKGNAIPDWMDSFPVGIKLGIGAYIP